MSVEEKVKEIVVDQLGVDEKQVNSEASFIDDLGADSLDTVELVMALEEEFDVEIPDEDAEKIGTVQNAIDYMLQNTAKTVNDITVEVDRYIAWPGQALAYKIGEMKILSLREQAEKNLGDKFNIRDFHDVVLGDGAVPLNILEKHVKDYIQSHD